LLLRNQAGMTSVTTAPLDPARIRPPALGRITARLHRAVVSLNRDPQSLVQATAPEAVLTAISRRGVVARQRLLLVSGQTAALVIAFAAFVASTRRRDLRLLESQLVDLGANRFQAWSVGASEVVLPGLAALVAAFAGLILAAILQTPAQEAHGTFISAALPLSTVLTIVAVIVAAVGLLVFFRKPAGGSPVRFGPSRRCGGGIRRRRVAGGLDGLAEREPGCEVTHSPVLCCFPR